MRIRGIPTFEDPDERIYGLRGEIRGVTTGRGFQQRGEHTTNIGWVQVLGDVPLPAPTPTPTNTPTIPVTPTATPAGTPGVTPTPTLTPTATIILPSATPTSTPAPTLGVSPTPTVTPSTTPSLVFGFSGQYFSGPDTDNMAALLGSGIRTSVIDTEFADTGISGWSNTAEFCDKWYGYLLPRETGAHSFTVSANNGFALEIWTVDSNRNPISKIVSDYRLYWSYNSSNQPGDPVATTTVNLYADVLYIIVIRHHNQQTETGGASLKVWVLEPSQPVSPLNYILLNDLSRPGPRVWRDLTIPFPSGMPQEAPICHLVELWSDSNGDYGFGTYNCPSGHATLYPAVSLDPVGENWRGRTTPNTLVATVCIQRIGELVANVSYGTVVLVNSTCTSDPAVTPTPTPSVTPMTTPTPTITPSNVMCYPYYELRYSFTGFGTVTYNGIDGSTQTVSIYATSIQSFAGRNPISVSGAVSFIGIGGQLGTWCTNQASPYPTPTPTPSPTATPVASTCKVVGFYANSVGYGEVEYIDCNNNFQSITENTGTHAQYGADCVLGGLENVTVIAGNAIVLANC